jgi:predicted pyridoxine 5'-phosphate oxidase superfamily flavin-nucleotide-binding protein
MSNAYHEGSRQMQDRHDSRRLADRMRHAQTFSEEDRAFIEQCIIFFLATADADGQPDVSYKGGLPGFVRVIDERTLAFPDYDGNGQFRSLGNILVNPRVGIVFMDFQGQQRKRVKGVASVHFDDPLLAEVSGRASRRPSARDGGLRQLPALHPQAGDYRALCLRSTPGAHAARARLEKQRAVPRLVAPASPVVSISAHRKSARPW